MARWVASSIEDLPVVSDGDAEDPVWYPLQHALGIDTFGANVFVADRDGQLLVEAHDESESGQQELYLLLDGTAVFELDGEDARLERGDALSIVDPTVRRCATALTAGTKLLVVGASNGAFESSWNAAHFADIPRPD
jgi:uncharacterized cupin superfamily protein